VHGGPDKAVYVYPSEHYPFWREELGIDDLPWGSFGENLTLEGWLEDQVAVGDRFRVGSVEVVVTQPRVPCFKLGLRFDREDVIEKFLDSGRSGFYLRVLVEGELEAGSRFERIEEEAHRVTVAEVNRLYLDRHGEPNVDLLLRAVAVEALAPGWREHFLRRLAHLGARASRPQ
jgi:MOSC domain-containing protein YiiM